MTNDFTMNCPFPINDYPNIVLPHGGGGKLTHQLIEKLFFPAFKNSHLETAHDGAVVSINNQKIAFSTDSYVVKPIFFPGGNIGSLAVYGTVNDLAMCGARPLYLSAGFIIEEGFPMKDLVRIVDTMKQCCEEAEVQLVTGDTKVVDKSKADGIFINTSGIGVVEAAVNVAPQNIKEGDEIILSGDLGKHGMCIMAVREGLEFESKIQSDCACLSHVVLDLIKSGVEIHCMRDLTRGGLATSLVELAKSSGKSIQIEESKIAVDEPVRGACEILGLDPLYVANEGRFIVIVKKGDSGKALSIMKAHSVSKQVEIIGCVTSNNSSLVTLKNKIGTNRIIDMLSGEQLPRIC